MTTIVSNSYYVGAYNRSGNYDSTAFRFTYSIEAGEQNTSTNKTKVTVKWSFTNVTSGWSYNYTGTNVYAYAYLKDTNANTSEKLLAKRQSNVHSAGATDILCSWTGELEHKKDGTLGVQLRLFFDGGESNNPLPRLHTKNLPSSSTYYSIPDIPRTSDVTVADTHSINDTSGNLEIKIMPKQATYHKCTWTVGESSTTINWGSISEETTKTISNIDILNKITTSLSGIINISIQTYTDSDYTDEIGSAITKSVSVTINGESFKPTIDKFVVSYNNGCPIGSYVVAGYSTLKCSASSAGQCGATIASKRFTSNKIQLSETTGNTAVMPASTSNYIVPITYTVTDSRGVTNSKTVETSVYGYLPPTIALSAYRCDSAGAQDIAGAYSKASGSGTVGALASQGNTIVTTVRSKSIDGGTSTDWTNNTITSLQSESSCVYTIKVTDKFGVSMTATSSIYPAIYPVSFYQDGTDIGVAIGTSADPGKFKVALETVFDKKTTGLKTSDITNDSNYVKSTELATVATSGSYNDLIDKPTISSNFETLWSGKQVSAGNITLSKGLNNFNFIIVEYDHQGDNTFLNSITIGLPSDGSYIGRKYELQAFAGGYLRFRTITLTNNTTIAVSGSGFIRNYASTTSGSYNENMYVRRIYGVKL